MTAWEHGILTTHPAGGAYGSSHTFAPVGGRVSVGRPAETWQDHLNRLGLEGWSIVAIVDEAESKGRAMRNIYMKRPLE